MKNYRVEYRWSNEEQCAGREPWSDIRTPIDGYVAAESPEEAIALALQDVLDGCVESGRGVPVLGEDYVQLLGENENEIERYDCFTAAEAE